jgi:hypothetical protein
VDGDQARSEAQREIQAIRSELAGRRDQLLVQVQEKLDFVDRLEKGLREGRTPPKKVQSEIQRLQGESENDQPRGGRSVGGSVGLRSKRAAGASPPMLTKSPATPVHSGKAEASAPRVHALFAKALARADARIMTLLEVQKAGDRGQGFLELSLLLDLRRAMAHKAEELPTDAVLLESLSEFGDHVLATLQILEKGGGVRMARLLEHLRTQLSKLTVLGCPTTGLKQRLEKNRALLEEGPEGFNKAQREASLIFTTMMNALDKHQPVRNPTHIDRLIYSALKPT